MTPVVEFKNLTHSRITLSYEGISLRIPRHEKKYLGRMHDIAMYSSELLHGKPEWYSLTGRFLHFNDRSFVILNIGKRSVASVDSNGQIRTKG